MARLDLDCVKGTAMTLESAYDTPRILIADDEESIRFLLTEVMRREGYDVTATDNGEKAVQLVRENNFDLVILDMRMPGMDGMQALKEMRRIRPHLVVLIITAHGTTELAVEAMRNGAYDYFTKPFELEEMRIVVRRALEKHQLLDQVSSLQSRLQRRARFDRIIGQSDAMRQVFNLLERVVTNDITVLITGESGTGKELVAQAVHYQSARKDKPFISVNCAAIPEALLESELFGHEKGAFTGAIGTHTGKFEAANGGSIFLDEVGDMPLALQAKLLRVLQEREIWRVGGKRPIKVDIRIIAATNRDLLKDVEARQFREDLYFRLNVLPIHLPPLRKRPSDIPMLVEHLVNAYSPRLGRNIRGVSPEAISAMMNYPWPGNVRELENVLQRAMVMTAGTVLDLADLPPQVQEARQMSPEVTAPSDLSLPADLFTDFSRPLAEKMEQLAEIFEKKIIIQALQKNGGHRQSTADLLGISRKSLHNKMVRYGLFDREDTTDATFIK